MSFSIPTQAQVGNFVSGASGLLQGIGLFQQARGEEQIGDYNAAIYEQQAQAVRANNKLLAYQKRRQIEATLGTQVARAGSSGLRYSGNPIDIALSSLTNANLDLAIDKYNTEVKARGLQSSAAMSRFEASQQSRLTYAKAGMSLLDTAYNQYKSYQEIGGGGKSG